MKTIDLMQKIVDTNQISEKEILLIKNRMNKGEQINVQIIWDNCPELTPEQNKKGIDFLLNVWKTPRGIERKNNPFGYREQNTLENFSHFELAGFYNNAKYGQGSFYIPLYNCIGSDGSAFQYYYNGKINIVG